MATLIKKNGETIDLGESMGEFTSRMQNKRIAESGLSSQERSSLGNNADAYVEQAKDIASRPIEEQKKIFETGQIITSRVEIPTIKQQYAEPIFDVSLINPVSIASQNTIKTVKNSENNVVGYEDTMYKRSVLAPKGESYSEESIKKAEYKRAVEINKQKLKDTIIEDVKKEKSFFEKARTPEDYFVNVRLPAQNKIEEFIIGKSESAKEYIDESNKNYKQGTGLEKGIPKTGINLISGGLQFGSRVEMGVEGFVFGGKEVRKEMLSLTKEVPKESVRLVKETGKDLIFGDTESKLTAGVMVLGIGSTGVRSFKKAKFDLAVDKLPIEQKLKLDKIMKRATPEQKISIVEELVKVQEFKKIVQDKGVQTTNKLTIIDVLPKVTLSKKTPIKADIVYLKGSGVVGTDVITAGTEVTGVLKNKKLELISRTSSEKVNVMIPNTKSYNLNVGKKINIQYTKNYNQLYLIGKKTAVKITKQNKNIVYDRNLPRKTVIPQVKTSKIVLKTTDVLTNTKPLFQEGKLSEAVELLPTKKPKKLIIKDKDLLGKPTPKPRVQRRFKPFNEEKYYKAMSENFPDVVSDRIKGIKASQVLESPEVVTTQKVSKSKPSILKVTTKPQESSPLIMPSTRNVGFTEEVVYTQKLNEVRPITKFIPISKVNSDLKQNNILEVKRVLDFKRDTNSKRIVEVKPMLDIKQNMRLDVIPKQMQDQRQKIDVLQKTKQREKILPRVQEKQKLKILGFFVPKSSNQASGGKFNVSVGRKGKTKYFFERMGLSLKEAVKFGKLSNLSGASASFKITPQGQGGLGELESANITDERFTTSKRDKYRFVQKSKYRISSSGEKQQISKARKWF